MGYALRKNWLVQEEQPETRAATLRSRHRPALPVAWQRMLGMTVLVFLVVTVAVLYIRCKDAIAQQEFRRQSLHQEMAQLSRECVQLNLEFNRASAEPHLSQIAAAQQFEMPTQIHYTRVAVAPAATQTASRRQLLASLHGLLQRVGTATADPAYAQE